MSSAPIPPSSAPSSHQNTTTTTSTPPKQKPTLAVLFAVITLLLAIAVAGFWGYTGSTSTSTGSADANLFGLRRFLGAGGRASASASASGSRGFGDRVMMAKTPVYFLSHGGVSFPYPILFLLFSPFYVLWYKHWGWMLIMCSRISCMIMSTRRIISWVR